MCRNCLVSSFFFFALRPRMLDLFCVVVRASATIRAGAGARPFLSLQLLNLNVNIICVHWQRRNVFADAERRQGRRWSLVQKPRQAHTHAQDRDLSAVWMDLWAYSTGRNVCLQVWRSRPIQIHFRRIDGRGCCQLVWRATRTHFIFFRLSLYVYYYYIYIYFFCWILAIFFFVFLLFVSLLLGRT